MHGIGPIVLVPGFMGSRLARTADARLIWVDPRWAPFHAPDFYDSLSLRTPADARLRADGALDVVPFCGVVHFDVYSPLRSFATSRRGLGLASADFVEFSYDWRKSVAEAAADLDGLLAALPNDGRGATLVAHSQGGLVAAALFARGGPGCLRVAKLVAVGSPLAGLLKTIEIIERDAGLLVGALAGHPIRRLLAPMPAAYELMPSGRAPALFADAAGRGTTPFAQAASLPAYYDRALLAAASSVVASLVVDFPVPLRLVEGYGVDTPTAAALGAAGVSVAHGLEGDGTCPSASLLAATSPVDRRVLSIPFGDHVPLIGHKAFLRWLAEDLTLGAPASPQIFVKLRPHLSPRGLDDLLFVQARDASGAPLSAGPPEASLPGGRVVVCDPFGPGHDGIWTARFPHPLRPGILRATIPGVAPALQPRPTLLA